MRIAIWHNLPSGGGKRALSDQVKGLVARGHHLECWCPPTADRDYLPLGNVIPEHIVALNRYGDQSMRGRRNSVSLLRATRQNLEAMDLHCRQCGDEIRKGEFDLIWANSCAFFAVSPIAKHTDLPSVLYLQEPFRVFYEASPESIWAARAEQTRTFMRPRHAKLLLGDAVRKHAFGLQIREEIQNAKRFDTLLVNSLFSRESVLRAYGLEASVCYLGIDPTRFYPAAVPKGGFVMGLGSLSIAKGPDRAIRSLALVPASIRPELVWVANAAEEAFTREIETLARELKVRFSLRVRISDEELRSLLSHAAMLLYTSRLEPFGYAPLEANACGTPVVAIAEGGIRETVVDGENGLLVESAEPEQVAAAVEKLLTDNSLTEKMRMQSVEWVRRRWTLDSSIDRLEAALRRVVVRNSSLSILGPG